MTSMRDSTHAAGIDGPASAASEAVASADIAEITASRAALLHACFSADERAHLSGRPDATIAGFLAVKRAWLDLAARFADGTACTERDIELSHSANGAPIVIRAHGPVDAARLRISVSHTRDTAYAVVCMAGGAS